MRNNGYKHCGDSKLEWLDLEHSHLDGPHESAGSDEILDFVLEGEAAASVTSRLVDVVLVNLAVLEDGSGVVGAGEVESAALSLEAGDSLVSQAGGDALLVLSELDESGTGLLDHGGAELGGALDDLERMGQLSVVWSSDHGDVLVGLGEKSVDVVVQAVEQELGLSGSISEAGHELVVVLGEHLEMESAGGGASIDVGVIGGFELAAVEFGESTTTDGLKKKRSVPNWRPNLQRTNLNECFEGSGSSGSSSSTGGRSGSGRSSRGSSESGCGRGGSSGGHTKNSWTESLTCSQGSGGQGTCDDGENKEEFHFQNWEDGNLNDGSMPILVPLITAQLLSGPVLKN